MLKISDWNTGVTTPGHWGYNHELNLIEFVPYKGDEVMTPNITTDSNVSAVGYTERTIEAFGQLMHAEIGKGQDKYGVGDATLGFVRDIDPNFELGAIAKYISRIARGDIRAETDIVKIATYAYFYWTRHFAK
jgi:hypothetical protein